MEIDYGKWSSSFDPGVKIKLDGDEVAMAIDAYLVAHGVYVSGARTVRVNDELCKHGRVYVDPSGYVSGDFGYFGYLDLS